MKAKKTNRCAGRLQHPRQVRKASAARSYCALASWTIGGGPIPTYTNVSCALAVVSSSLAYGAVHRRGHAAIPLHDDTTAFSKTCKKCGGRSELVATIWDRGYGVYRCLNCKFIDWVPRETQAVIKPRSGGHKEHPLRKTQANRGHGT